MTDLGTGILDEKSRRIVERFYRRDLSRTSGGEYAGLDGAMRITILLLSLAAVTGFHFLIGTATSVEHIFHVLFRLAYFIPLILSALWFGAKGAAWMSAACGLLLSVHLFISWSGNLSENINQIAIIILFPFIGVGVGTLVDREIAERERRRRQEKLTERRTIMESISALSAALNAKDLYTREHSEAVAVLAVRIGVELRLSEESLDLLYLAGTVHDIGKIGLRDDILFKPSQVDAAEMEHIRRHPEIASNILRPISGADRVAELVLLHHEQIDGSGYPRGVKGDEIPLEARILTVADIYSALIDERSYKRTMQRDEALAVLRSMSGTKVDARVVWTLEHIFEESEGAI